MSSIARLLVATLCLFSLPDHTQDHSTINSPAPGTIQTTHILDFRTTPPPSEPWRIFANGRGQDKTVVVTPDKGALLTRDGLSTDNVCYAIRSYVVARDSKDSDSVHPVSYSTCQPASRYRLKKTVFQQDPFGR